MPREEQANTSEQGAEKVVEQTATEASASFLEGFNEAEEPRQRQAPAEKTPEAKPAAETPPAKPAETTAAPAAAAAEASPIPGVSMVQFKELMADIPRLRSELAQAHGKIGELNRTIQAGKPAAPAPAQAGAPAAEKKPVEEGAFDPASFVPADWAQLYPDFALYVESMVESRAKALIAANPGGDQSEMVAKIHMDMLSMWQPDWKKLVKSSDYSLWLATQPAATQNTAHTTENALELSQVIQAFKDSQKAPAGDAAADPTQAQQSRLESAVVPAGTATHAASAVPTAHEEFLAGFNSG